MNTPINSREIRQIFLKFFAQKGHTIVPSSSLIPAQDPSLLFTNAGMNQFKDIFLGKEKRSYSRAVTCQKCVRAGGKHNDLENVGFTERHLTFFEMLGNFSFGDYFKKEAISYAWEFLTVVVNLPADKLYASVFRDDSESYALWQKHIGLPVERIVKLGEKDNFWQMGDTGPCGPCTEIYLDRGADKGCRRPDCAPGCDCARFIEIWNLVFMQYDRQYDGQLKPLDVKGVDTGMGLERLCMVLQGKENVFFIDQMQALITHIEQLSQRSYEKSDENTQASFRVLADHIRSCGLLMADGCTPSNEGRGYVLRKIIRRAALFSQKLSPNELLFAELVSLFIDEMKDIYPELEERKQFIIAMLSSELVKFQQNLVSGQQILERYIIDNKKVGIDTLTGEQVFKLYDTYGFPPELTNVIAREKQMKLDMATFEKEMAKQQEQSGKKKTTNVDELLIAENLSTVFKGYDVTELESTISFIQAGEGTVWIITEETPFYGESGGQTADVGIIEINNISYNVLDMRKLGDRFNPAVALKLACSSPDCEKEKGMKIGDKVRLVVDKKNRISTAKNHTATHILQASLMSMLGSGIKQSGSLVCPDYLRFDFTHHESLSKETLDAIEQWVNEKIQEDIALVMATTTLQDAQAQGAVAFFGEKYNPEKVRMVKIPGVSTELCGGTHVTRTGVIGMFKIISETALSAGVRRVIAVTGTKALEAFQQSYSVVKQLSEQFKAKPELILDAVEKLAKQNHELQNYIKKMKKQFLLSQVPSLLNSILVVADVPFLYATFDDVTIDDMRGLIPDLEKQKPGLYVMIGKDIKDMRFSFIIYASPQFEHVVSLKNLSEFLKERAGLRCGGSPTMLQGGGTTLSGSLQETIALWLREQKK
jgi:alanyl-tRNA synthetase